MLRAQIPQEKLKEKFAAKLPMPSDVHQSRLQRHDLHKHLIQAETLRDRHLSFQCSEIHQETSSAVVSVQQEKEE